MRWIDLAQHDSGLWLDQRNHRLVCLFTRNSGKAAYLFQRLVDSSLFEKAPDLETAALLAATAPVRKDRTQGLMRMSGAALVDVEMADVEIDAHFGDLPFTHIEIVPGMSAGVLGVTVTGQGDDGLDLPSRFAVMLPFEAQERKEALEFLASPSGDAPPAPVEPVHLSVHKASLAGAVSVRPDLVLVLLGEAGEPLTASGLRVAIDKAAAASPFLKEAQESRTEGISGDDVPAAGDNAPPATDDSADNSDETPGSLGDAQSSEEEDDSDPHADTTEGRRKLVDFGEVIPDARKDRYRGIDRNLINDLDESGLREFIASQRTRSLSKDAIWPRPSPRLCREAGLGYPHYMALLECWKAVAASPNVGRGRYQNGLSLKQARLYMIGISSFRDFCMDAQTVGDLAKRFAGVQQAGLDDEAELRRKAMAESARSWTSSTLIPRTLFYNTPDAETADGSDLWKVETIVSPRKRYSRFNLITLTRTLQSIAELPATWEDFDAEKAEKRKQDGLSGEEGESGSPDGDSDADQDAGVQADVETSIAVRKGLADRRDGKDIPEDILLARLGFRGGQFGNWVSQKERAAFLNVSNDSLLDLADIVGITARDVGLEGRLGLAWGARGRGRASAHYEPNLKVINMTRLNGAGSLAHEWAHALDHWLYDHLGDLGRDTLTGRGTLTPFLSEKMFLVGKRIGFTAMNERGGVGLVGRGDPADEMHGLRLGIAQGMAEFVTALRRTRLVNYDNPLAKILTSRFLPRQHLYMSFFKRFEVHAGLLSVRGLPLDFIKDEKQRGVLHPPVFEKLCRDRLYDEIIGGFLAVNPETDRLVVNESGMGSVIRTAMTATRDCLVERIGNLRSLVSDRYQVDSFDALLESLPASFADYQQRYWDNLAENLERYIFQHVPVVSELERYRSAETIPDKAMTLPSDMLVASESVPGKARREYLTSMVEMFARGYEACVAQELAAQGATNTYLVGPKTSKIYPQAEQMKDLLPAFQSLNTAIRNYMAAIAEPDAEVRAESRKAKHPRAA